MNFGRKQIEIGLCSKTIFMLFLTFQYRPTTFKIGTAINHRVQNHYTFSNIVILVKIACDRHVISYSDGY